MNTKIRQYQKPWEETLINTLFQKIQQSEGTHNNTTFHKVQTIEGTQSNTKIRKVQNKCEGTHTNTTHVFQEWTPKRKRGKYNKVTC